MNPTSKLSLNAFGLIAGLGILLMSSSPYAEFIVYGKLVDSGNAAITFKNITAHETLFISGILSYLFNFICDIVVAWALYGLLKPVNESLSLLTAWFQLVYAVISLVATVHLVTVLRLIHPADYMAVYSPEQQNSLVMQSLYAFRDEWSFGFFFFAFHLIMLGYLVFMSEYIPRIMGICLIIAGSGYLINTLQPFLYPKAKMDFITITYFGELIFMFWLLIKGWRITKKGENKANE
ncbi:MAG TPA: DUF4386 domain-containing protein [Puia sp.]|jgi:hypothetical protein|nr:DUF4386 domain-containing protein [Puia sp.]